jgi:hypothetical protein
MQGEEAHVPKEFKLQLKPQNDPNCTFQPSLQVIQPLHLDLQF